MNVMANFVPRGAVHIQGDHRRTEVTRKDTKVEIISQLYSIIYVEYKFDMLPFSFSLQAFKLYDGILLFTVCTNRHPLHGYVLFKNFLLAYRCMKPRTLTL